MSSLTVGSISGPDRRAVRRSVSSWIQKQASRTGLLTSPVLAIGLTLAGLAPLLLLH